MAAAALTLATTALAFAGPAPASAATADKGVPDPLAAGPHAVEKIEYDAGSVLLTHQVTGETIAAPMRGSIWYPDDTTDPGRVVVYVHGRHTACIGTPPAGSYFCDDETSPDGTPTTTPIRSYGGYDYLGKNLATHGYVVMSVEANLTNFDNGWRLTDARFPATSTCAGGWCDGGASARSMVIEASLQLLLRWTKGQGPIVPGDDAHTVGTKLVGKADLANGIGMMGHSRGGDAVTDFIGYNRRVGAPRRWKLDAVLALAPVNYTKQKIPYGTNYGVLLPACDGDVSTLQGARFFENAKYAAGGDTFAKVQWYVQGTNHNFFNTVWVDDDFGTNADAACNRAAEQTARLTPTDQRRVGQALMNGFMRRYVGGETAFEPLMTGEVTLPESAAPKSSGKGTGQTVKTSYVAPAAKRLDVLRPAPVLDDGNPYAPGSAQDQAATATTVSAQGGALTAKDLATFAVCMPPDVAFRQGPILAKPYPDCPKAPSSTTNINRSIGSQFTVDWTKPATLTAALDAAGATKDVSGFGALHLRAAVNRFDTRNPQGDNANPASATQDFDVTLVDAAGNRATTNAARWSTALQPSIGTRFPHVTLNGIRVPVTAFTGVDLTKIVAVELGFGTRTPAGSIQLGDVMFEEGPAPVEPATEPEVPGPPAPEPGPIVGTPQQITINNVYPTAPTSTSASSSACVDGKAPSSALATLAVRGGRIRLSGAAADAGCAAARPGTNAAGGVRRTFVSIYRKAGAGCRYVSAGGRLLAASDCDTPLGVYAKGTTSWSLSVSAAKLPAGRYAVRVTTFDRTGNVKRLRLRWITVR